MEEFHTFAMSLKIMTDDQTGLGIITILYKFTQSLNAERNRRGAESLRFAEY